MKKFVFELEDVLKFRTFEQQQAEIELGKALAQEKEIQEKLDALASQQVAVKQTMKGSTDFYAITNANNFFSFVKNQTEYLLGELAKAKLVSDQKREVLKTAMQKTSALEKLKERQLEDYNAAVSIEEDDFADDIVTSRFSR